MSVPASQRSRWTATSPAGRLSSQPAIWLARHLASWLSSCPAIQLASYPVGQFSGQSDGQSDDRADKERSKTALQKIHGRLDTDYELLRLHLKHHHLTPKQFRYRTKQLNYQNIFTSDTTRLSRIVKAVKTMPLLLPEVVLVA